LLAVILTQNYKNQNSSNSTSNQSYYFAVMISELLLTFWASMILMWFSRK